LDFEKLEKNTKYPYLISILLSDRQNLLDRLINKFSYLLFRKHWIVKGVDRDVDVIFPNPISFYFENFKHKLFWIPDLQEKYFPKFFSNQELSKRDRNLTKLALNNNWIVFSSNAAMDDFIKFYPNYNAKVFVLPFAVTLPALDGIKEEDVRKKYNLRTNFFICSNQFWTHKNHQQIIKAVSGLKREGIDVQVAFTGKPWDYRNPDYCDQLKKLVKQLKLEDNIRFLGFIDRTEQLILIKKSKAVIQPSLFEGWSTVVEDVKALNKPIIISDLAVHKEQLPGYLYFFNAKDEIKLSEWLKIAQLQELKPPDLDYEKAKDNFAKNFISIVHERIKK